MRPVFIALSVATGTNPRYPKCMRHTLTCTSSRNLRSCLHSRAMAATQGQTYTEYLSLAKDHFGVCNHSCSRWCRWSHPPHYLRCKTPQTPPRYLPWCLHHRYEMYSCILSNDLNIYRLCGLSHLHLYRIP